MGKADVYSIPQELVDIIIDYLHNDGGALRICALVCKNWIPCSRYHLFEKIGHCLYVDPESYTKLLRLLDTPCCTLVPFLHRLVIEDRGYHYFQARKVVQLLNKLPELHAISMRLHRADETWHDAQCLFSGFTKITDVCIGGDYSNYVLEVACSFPLLESLHLRVRGWKEGQVLYSRVPIPRTLCILHMETATFIPALNWLMSADQMPALHTIRMSRAPWGDLPCIGEFLAVLGNTLLHFDFDFCSYITLMGAKRLNLTTNTNLRSLTIGFSDGRANDSNSINRNYLTEIFSQISSPHVEDLIIKPELQKIDDIWPEVWADMRRIFEWPQFSRLKRVSFTLNVRCFGDLAELVCQRLPECHQRGILVLKDSSQ